jgi:hypothetical protein
MMLFPFWLPVLAGSSRFLLQNPCQWGAISFQLTDCELLVKFEGLMGDSGKGSGAP